MWECWGQVRSFNNERNVFRRIGRLCAAVGGCAVHGSVPPVGTERVTDRRKLFVSRASGRPGGGLQENTRPTPQAQGNGTAPCGSGVRFYDRKAGRWEPGGSERRAKPSAQRKHPTSLPHRHAVQLTEAKELAVRYGALVQRSDGCLIVGCFDPDNDIKFA